MVNREKAEIFTKQSLKNSNDWDPLTQRVKRNTPVNTALTKLESAIQDIYNERKYNTKQITAIILKDQYLGKEQNSILLSDYIDTYYKEKVLGNSELSEGTLKNYRATITHIKTFLSTSNQKNISLHYLDNSFLKKLDTHLLSTTIGKDTKTLKRNTVNKYHTKLKCILNSAVSEGILDRNPYLSMKLKNETGTRTFLTRPELDLIEGNSLGGNESLQRVRDIFMFSVYTGLRFNDAINLKSENIESDGKKNWILFRQQKTKDHTRLPMLLKATEIYDRYLIERSTTGFVLPRISNQKLNAYLKVIADMIGLTKPLTHHVARHTNATTIFLANGASLEMVSRQLGHSSIRTTQVYAKITNDMLSKTADKIDDLLK
jgi:site-specific recombinase XerD